MYLPAMHTDDNQLLILFIDGSANKIREHFFLQCNKFFALLIMHMS